MAIYDNGKNGEGLTPEEQALYDETMKRLGKHGRGDGFGKAVATLAKEINDYRQKIAALTETIDVRNDDIVELQEANRRMVRMLQELQAPKPRPKVETTKNEEGETVITIRTAQAIDNVDVYFRED